MAIRTAEAEWKGSLNRGLGRMKLGSGVFEGPYSFASRFKDGPGTNPEELIGAAHAGCFSMALSHMLAEAGHETVAGGNLGTPASELVLDDEWESWVLEVSSFQAENFFPESSSNSSFATT